jgi:hypothetical protein
MSLSRSVHNTRIERLWRDVTTNWGKKWKDFFLMLVDEHGLMCNKKEHLWLLHHLFLDAINVDAAEWAHTWNSHKMKPPHDQPRNLTPIQSWQLSMTRVGASASQIAAAGFPLNYPGVIPTPFEVLGREEEPVSEAELFGYGVDHADLEDADVLQRISDALDAENATTGENRIRQNPFATNVEPRNHPYVKLDPPIGPLSEEQIQQLNEHLQQSHDLLDRDMSRRKDLWVNALQFCQGLFD